MYVVVVVEFCLKFKLKFPLGSSVEIYKSKQNFTLEINVIQLRLIWWGFHLTTE